MKDYIYIYILFASILVIASCTSPIDTGKGSSLSPTDTGKGSSSDKAAGGRLSYDKAAGRQLSYKPYIVPKTAADSSFTNPLTQSDVPDDTGTITYTSSDKAVAAVDENSGEVTIITAGETIITAIKKATARYAESIALYVLTVTPAEGVQLSYKAGTVVKSPSDDPFTNELTQSDVPDDTGTVTYTSGNEGVARVDGNGEVTIVGVGKTTITAAKEATTGKFKAHTAQYTIIVSRGEAGKQLSYRVTDLNKSRSDIGSSFTNPLSVSDVPDDTGAITYTSTYPGTATVDKHTGEVTLLEVGSVLITATKAATARYAEITAEYALTIYPR